MTAAAAGEPLLPPSTAVAPPFKRYRVVNGCLARARIDAEGIETVEPLAGFDARIDEELLYDDGAESSRAFVISGRTQDGQPLKPLTVKAGDFAGMAWVTKGWGTAGVVEAGCKEHLRTAILKLSKPRQRRIFRRTGWVEIGGEWAFLFGGGAVGAEGVEVELDAPLDRFHLPDAVEDLPDAVRTSLSLLDCGPPSVTIPLLGAVYLAPLSFILRPDLVVWTHAPSGSLKSELASLAQAHFGDFDRKSLPACWASTEAALQTRLHTLADVLVTIDDFNPQANIRADRELRQRAERILRSIGNQAARGRARGDLSHRPDHPPRGLVLSTGESLPAGHSLNARLVPVELDRSRLDLAAVTRLQARRQRLPHALRGYLDWLRPRMHDLRETLPARRDELRTVFQAGGHLRQGDALAHVYLGIELFTVFASDVGVMTSGEIADLRARARAALVAIGERQSGPLAGADPAERFMEVLSTLFAQRRLSLEPARGGGPASPGEVTIGYRTPTNALILPKLAYRQVAAHLRAAGEHWSPVASQLYRELAQKGYVSLGPDGRAISQHRIGDGRRVRVLNIPLGFLTGQYRASQPSQPSHRSEAGPSAEGQNSVSQGNSS